MDKNAIKKFAIWARRELIERVSQRAAIYGITAEDHGAPEAESVNGRLLSASEKNQRRILINSIKEKGFEQVIEEVAYTWFNRFAALRFMEVNGYLPSHIRVFTNEAGEFKPQILSEAIHLNLEGLNKDKVYELENDNKTEELFKYLLVVQCNALNSILPGMFQRIDDYTELLLPDNLLREGSVIEKLVVQGTSDSIPESDWTDQVQIIGWLYQYYNTEPKQETLNDIKSSNKVQKNKIAAATQLFTPDWIVSYMVENSLGRLWLDGHPNCVIKSNWNFYLEDAEQEAEIEKQLNTMYMECAFLKPEDIRVIDPCMGSGHILCTLFDTLITIYECCGYTAREATIKIVENNLWGLDIDGRAAQLSYFAIMMKARQHDRRFFTRNIRPHVYEIVESNCISTELIDRFGEELSEKERSFTKNQMLKLVSEMSDARDYGSLITVSHADWDLLRRYTVINACKRETQLELNYSELEKTLDLLQKLIDVGQTLSQHYDVVVTNPPYLGYKGINSKLLSFIQKKYPGGKSDLYGAFVYRCQEFVRNNGYIGLLTPYVWMYLSSFKTLREDLLKNTQIISLIQLEYNAFEVATVPVCTYILRKMSMDYIGRYIQLASFKGWDNQKPRTLAAINDFSLDYCFESKQSNFKIIQDSPISYWLPKSIYDVFMKSNTVIKYGTPKQGLITGDNNAFLRLWFEVDLNKIGFRCEEKDRNTKTWFPHSKGGAVRRWYGNNDYVVNWKDNGKQIKNFFDKNGKLRSRPQNESSYFQSGITWSDLTISWFSARYVPKGFIFDGCGPTLFLKDDSNILYMCGYFNSWIFQEFLNITCQGMHYSNGIIGQLPCVIADGYKKERIETLVKECIQLSQKDWDEHERSWDFACDCLVKAKYFIKDAVYSYLQKKESDIERLRINEQELNSLFAEIFEMQDIVPSKGTCPPTLNKKSESELITSFISYAVGCMFGRYSLDVTGLVYAGGTWDPSKYTSFPADTDAIIPICDDEYFEDDIVGLFIIFVEKVYGKETLEENLQFIADALGGKGTSREIIRNYFMNGFYSDHVKVYQKRPIYWLFDSGKKNGFKCLIYLHRYKPDTIARIRTDYIHEQQSRYRTAIEDLNRRIDGALPSEKVKLNKQLTKVMDQAEEIRVYEEKIHHLADQMIEIDLDDGVKVNYAKFQDVLAKI